MIVLLLVLVGLIVILFKMETVLPWLNKKMDVWLDKSEYGAKVHPGEGGIPYHASPKRSYKKEYSRGVVPDPPKSPPPMIHDSPIEPQKSVWAMAIWKVPEGMTAGEYSETTLTTDGMNYWSDSSELPGYAFKELFEAWEPEQSGEYLLRFRGYNPNLGLYINPEQWIVRVKDDGENTMEEIPI